MKDIEVSVVMPVYNEEKYIERCLKSLYIQTYPKESIEWLFIDGCSKDKTVEKIKQFNFPNCYILKNEKRIVTYALNIGIDHSIGKFIIRMDAHAEYAADYIEKCVFYLKTTDAENVGGIAITKGNGFIGQANSEILSSKFGVGNSNFRVGNKSGYVDTVPFGAFKREVFEKIGKFDVDLPRSEDNDFNSRIRASGGKVFLASDISFTYYCRDTVKGLLGQALKNGDALFLTIRKNLKAMSLRHYIPFLFVLSLIVVPIISFFIPLFWLCLIVESGLYLMLDLFFSFCKGKKKFVLYKLVMYPLFHIAYGIGSLLGMINVKLY